MKHLNRVVLSLFGVLVVYLIIYRLIFSADFRAGGHAAEWTALGIAVFAGVLIWVIIKPVSDTLPGYLMGGVFLGLIAGPFIGVGLARLVAPGNNLAPLVGMVVCTPFGILTGILLARGYWFGKGKKGNAEDLEVF